MATITPHINLRHLNQYVAGCYSNDLGIQRCSVANIRKLLSVESYPPIHQVINAKYKGKPFICRLIEMIEFNLPCLEAIKFEASWVLLNISAGTHDQVNWLISHGLLPKFIKLMSSKTDQIQINAVWAIGNCSGDSPEFRDLILNEPDLFDQFMPLCNLNLSSTLEKNVAWTLSNLARGKPAPKLKHVHKLVECLNIMIKSRDNEILRDIAWGYCYISNAERNSGINLNILNINNKQQRKSKLLLNGFIRNIRSVYNISIPLDIVGVCYEYFIVIDNGIKTLIELLKYNDAHIVHPILKSVGNFLLLIDDKRILLDVIKTYDAFEAFIYLLTTTKRSKIRKECCNMLGKIICKSNIVDENVIYVLIQIARFDNIEVGIEALVCLSNVISTKRLSLFNYFIDQGGVKLLIYSLNRYVKRSEIIYLTLKLIKTSLNAGKQNEKRNGYNKILNYFKLSNLCNELEILMNQSHSNIMHDKIINLINNITTQYFNKNDVLKLPEPYFVPQIDKNNPYHFPDKKFIRYNF